MSIFSKRFWKYVLYVTLFADVNFLHDLTKDCAFWNTDDKNLYNFFVLAQKNVKDMTFLINK